MSDKKDFYSIQLEKIKKIEPPIHILKMPYNGEMITLSLYSNGTWDGLPCDCYSLSNIGVGGFELKFNGVNDFTNFPNSDNL